MAPIVELTEEEVLERLKKILKGLSIVLHMVPEYRADNPPPDVSCFTSVSTFLYICFIVGTIYLQFLAQSFFFGRLWRDDAIAPLRESSRKCEDLKECEGTPSSFLFLCFFISIILF
jgi:hypothetical protein